jgi:SWI/SNF-related matrix-associated actin-dependent regulator 1 of chromatin subfamily A
VATKQRKPDSLPHQRTGTRFLRERERAALFDEQGLGKSKQLIDAVAAEIAADSIRGALIVCPNGLKSNWADEVERFSPLPYAVFGSGRKARRVAFRSLRAAFYIINYEAIAAELPSLRALLRFKPMAFVLDESHRIKTPDSKVTRAILQLRTDAKRRYLLTGTPVANKPEDLWSQVFFLDDGEALGATFEEFRGRYCSVEGGYQSVEDLRERVARLALRRTKSKALRLPPKQFVRVAVDLAPKQRLLYDQMRNELALWVHSLSGEEVLQQGEAILARMVRLAQLASNPTLLDSGYKETPAKFLALDSALATLSKRSDQKAIVWTSFVDNIKALKARYTELSPVTLYGEMDNAARSRAVNAFRRDSQVRLLVANPAAAREGLTLTEANLAIYLDRTFNLVDYLQSQDRIHRISQTRPCEIVLLLANSTIDEFIDFSLEQKHRLAKFTQKDDATITADDLALRKPEILRALISPSDTEPRRRREVQGARHARAARRRTSNVDG